MIDWIIANWVNIVAVIGGTCTVASLIVKLTPTLKDDNIVLPIIKFISKFIALNTPTPTERPK